MTSKLLRPLPPPHQFRDDDVTSCHSASVNPHRMSESDSNTSISVDGSITDSSPASPSVDSYSGTKVTKSRDTTPNKCDNNSIESHKDSSPQPSSSDPPVLHYKQLASIVDSTKKNPTITRKVKPLRPIKKHGNLVQGTIRAALANIATGSTPKRKMSPGKAADTDMDNKVPRSDRHDI